MIVYSYVRASTRQAERSGSLEDQERTIAGYAMVSGLLIRRSYVERGVSGSVPFSDRLQGGTLLGILQPGDIVITPKFDRMFRSALDALAVIADLEERGISLHICDLGGDIAMKGISNLAFTILSAVAEAERDRRRDRIIAVKADQKARGDYLGGKIPYGFSLVQDGSTSKLEPVPEQQEVIRIVQELRNQGKTLRAIRTAVNNKISLPALSRVLRGKTGE